MGLENKIEAMSKAYSDVDGSVAMGRLSALFDEGTFTMVDALAGSAGIVAGFGTVEGVNAYAFAQNIDVEGGSVSAAVSVKVKKIYDMAVKTGCPVIGIYDSNGAKLKDGNAVLETYGEMLGWTGRISGVVPQISLVLGTCVGSAALAAASADVVIAVSGVSYGIDTSGKDVSAADADKKGEISIITENEEEAVNKCRMILSMLPSNNIESVPVFGFDEPDTSAASALAAKTATKEKTALDIISSVADLNSFIELNSGFGAGAVTGLATVNGGSVGVIANNYGETGKLDSDSATKAARFLRFCDAFSIPVVTFIDCAGFDSLRDASKLASAYTEATTAKVAVITGAAYGAAFIAMAGRSAGSDFTVAWPSAVISPLAPETACAILYNDRVAKAANPKAERNVIVEEYKDNEASPVTAAISGIIDDVISPENTRVKLIAALDALSGKRVSTLPKKHSNIQL